MLWLWRRPAAIALIRPLAWEPPCATGAALEKGKKTTGISDMSKWSMNLTSIHEDAGMIPDLAQWVKDLALP